MRSKIEAIYQAAGIAQPKQPWHVLRHSFCTNAALAGLSMVEIAELAGHKSIETTRRYMHVSDTQKREAIARVFGGPDSLGPTVGPELGAAKSKAPLTV